MAEMFAIHPDNPQARLLDQVAELLADGGIVAYPTDSCYALGWRLGDKGSQDRIRRLKKLDKHHYFTLVCKDLSEVATYARVSNQAYRMMRSMTPGPYTFILPATRQVPNRLMHPKRRTIGLRVPAHRIAQGLLDALGEPLMSTTLKLPEDPDPLNDPWEIQARLDDKLVAVIDAGPCGINPTSVIDLTGPAPEIIRRGAGDVEFIEPAGAIG
jgi:tRNA threonylcarbamoyl adenosine modification protein (Sua5/YciO/YrdC/YwlC family)